MTFYDSNSRMNLAMYETAWKLVTKWLRNRPSDNFLPVSPIFPYVFSCFTYCFPSSFGYFTCFSWCFSLFPILGLTVTNHFDTHKLTFARQKSTLWIKRKKKFWYKKTFTALVMNTWLFLSYPIEKRLNTDYTLPDKLNWKVFNIIEIKTCS